MATLFERMTLGPDPIEELIRLQLKYLREDPNREGLLETPKRVAFALRDLTRGYIMHPEDYLKTFEEGTYDQLIAVKNIPFFSLCEHHILPFKGVVHIGYVPAGRILGLSKFARIVEVFSKRLQVQERMTQQICDALNNPPLSPRGVMVVVEAEHFCMAMRGVEVDGATTETSAITGVFNNPEKRAREEFLALLRR
jgi:GTP cyclohydrolase IA